MKDGSRNIIVSQITLRGGANATLQRVCFFSQNVSNCIIWYAVYEVRFLYIHLINLYFTMLIHCSVLTSTYSFTGDMHNLQLELFLKNLYLLVAAWTLHCFAIWSLWWIIILKLINKIILNFTVLYIYL